MDANMTQRRRGLEDKIPDIKKTLNMVEYLQERRVSELLNETTLLVLNIICRKERVKPVKMTTLTMMKTMHLKSPYRQLLS